MDIKKEFRIRKLLEAGTPSARIAGEAVDSIVEAAQRHARRGDSAERYLYTLEKDVLAISDSLLKLHNCGMDREYRDLWERLWLFVQSCEQSVYMPLCLFILYRYAQAVLCAGDPEKAEKLYHNLLERTDSMIGTDNTYGILCWDRIGTAAAAAGKMEQARQAYREAVRVAERNLGPYSLLTLAVQHRLVSVQDGIAARRNRCDLYLKLRGMLGEKHPLTRQLLTEYTEADN